MSATDEFLERWRHRDPEAFAAGERRVAEREIRRRFLTSLVGWRDAHSVDQTTVAHRMDTSQSAVARLESGLTDPKLSTLQRYASAVGCELRLSLTPRLEGVPEVEEADSLEAVMRLASATLVAGRFPKKGHAQALEVKVASGPEEEGLGISRVPGKLTISGVTGSAEKLGKIIEAASEHTLGDDIFIVVDMPAHPRPHP